MSVFMTVNTVSTGASNDVTRTSFTPDEICTLTMEFYRRNYIEGLFLSSGILKTSELYHGADLCCAVQAAQRV